MKPIRAWLSRESSGLYMLSALRPIAKRGAFYVRTGDPIGVRHLCPQMITRLFGIELETMQMKRVQVSGKVI